MKYAKLIKLGGELIPVDKADYSTYDGGLICPECGEDVFLRKSHTRANQEVSAAFCHKRAIPEVSACELRVGRYTQQDVERMAGEARDQRRRKLQVSLWKYLKKTKCALNISGWANQRLSIKKHYNEFHTERQWEEVLNLVRFGVEILINRDSIVEILKLVDQAAESFFEYPVPQTYKDTWLDEFVKNRRHDSALHIKICKEVCSFLFQEINKSLLERFAWGFIFVMGKYHLLVADIVAKESTQQEFLEQLVRNILIVIFCVDWIEIFDCKTPTKVLQHSHSRQKSA